MKHDYNLTAVVRSELGKGASRRLRRVNERVAAIIYGGNVQPTPIAIDKPALYKMVEEEAFFSSIINIDVEGKTEQVVVRDLQRHPYKPVITHADFMRVSANEEITLTVQLHFANEESCKGVKEDGGVLHILATDVEVSCLPTNIPEYLELDVGALGLGDTLHLSDIKMPAGVSLVALGHGDDHNIGVVTVTRPAGGAGEDDEAAAADAGNTDNSPE